MSLRRRTCNSISRLVDGGFSSGLASKWKRSILGLHLILKLLKCSCCFSFSSYRMFSQFTGSQSLILGLLDVF